MKTMEAEPDEQFNLIIEPGGGIRRYWGDLWQYRELFIFLAWRDILVRYKQTAIGVAWSVLRPVLTMAAFTVIFGTFARLPSEGGAPYPVLVFAALLPWQLFANTLSESSGSLIADANLLSKVYFPRLIVPASKVITCLLDVLISLAFMAVLMAWYRFLPGWQILALPIFLLLALLIALGTGLWLAALNVKYRDFRYVIPFVVQLGLYVSPVGFSSTVVPPEWRALFSLNPMVGVIDGFRWCLLGGQSDLYLPGLFLSIVLSLIIFIFGLTYFRSTERTFADLI